MGNSTTNKPKNSKWHKHDMFVQRNLNFSNWMGDMSEYIKDTRLVDLRLIRSHQSATFCIDSFLDSVSICQNNSIYYQLYGGVRVLDLRPGVYDNANEITCGHGPHKAVQIAEVFTEVRDFLLEHPKEFVIIEMETAPRFFGINHELLPRQKNELIQMINIIFGDMLIKSSDAWFDLQNVTMKQVWDNNKRVLVISHCFIINWKELDFSKNINRHHKNAPPHHNLGTEKVHHNHNSHHLPPKKITQEEAMSLGVYDMFSNVFGRYANTTDKTFMLKHVSKFIENSQDRTYHSYNQFLSVNLQLTPQSIRSIYDLNASLHQDEFLYKWLIDLLVSNKRLNIIAFDFCFYNPQFVREIIFSNYYISNVKSKFKDFPLKIINNVELCEISNENFTYPLRQIIYNHDILKLKLCYYNNYVTVDKNGFVSLARNLNFKKIRRSLFQLEIVDRDENIPIVRIKSCYFSSKIKKGIFEDFYIFINETSNMEGNRNAGINLDSSSSSSFKSSKKQFNSDCIILKENSIFSGNCDENKNKGSLFKLKFVSSQNTPNYNERVCFIEYVTCSNEKNKYLAINSKDNTKLILSDVHSDDKFKLFYLEK